MLLVLPGRISPLDGDHPTAVFKGRVFIDDSGTIVRVAADAGPVPLGFQTA